MESKQVTKKVLNKSKQFLDSSKPTFALMTALYSLKQLHEIVGMLFQQS